MKTIELDMYQATAVAALVLLLGRILVAKISILRRYCIPAPVVGGFLYAIVHTIVRGMGILEISCDMTLKNVFMVGNLLCSQILSIGLLNLITYIQISLLDKKFHDPRILLGMTATDLVILDLKHIDPEKHRLLTGHSNESILSFARFLDQIHKHMWVRHVLVPGITDDPANLHGIRAFLDTLSNVEKVEILPYHTLGIYKWETLGIPYSLSGIRIPDENDLKRANQILLG